MNSLTAATLASLALVLAACKAAPDYGRPLPEGAPALIPLGPDDERPDFVTDWNVREDILPALDRSIAWMKLESSGGHFPIAGISHEVSLASLERFRELLIAGSRKEFLKGLEREFTVYKSAGWDGRGGGVLFTGYCTPILEGSTEPRTGFDYPLYALPSDLEKGPDGEILGRRTAAGLEPYPTRAAIEAGALLEGRDLELVWLKSPIDSYIAHVNGSAFIRLPDGDLYRLGYSGKNGRPYTSLGKELIEDGRMDAEDLNLQEIREWAHANPEEVAEYLRRNESYVFFTPITGNPRGSLNVEVSAERSLATDKTLFPRGAVVFVRADLPIEGGSTAEFHQFMLDQDTGGAIRTAGRADIYLGVGSRAERRAGSTRSEGQLYYLFLSPIP